MPIAVAWGLFVEGGGDVHFWGALNAGSPFWGASVGSFSGMCAFAALRRVVF